jgi:sodium/proline symporter
MTTSNIFLIIAIVIYMAMVVWIGINCSKKNKTSDDFYLGGRKLGPFVTAMSAEASDMSSWLLMGLPGVALAGSIAEASWTAIGLAVGTYINWLIVARRLRLYSAKLNSITIPDFFSNRFRDKSNFLMIIAALIIVVFFVPYTASGFSACGKLFSTLFGFDYFWAMVVSALVIVLYTMLGGFLAANQVEVLICGGIGGGAQNALAQAGIQLYGGVTGEADAAVEAFIADKLNYNPDVQCNHHGEGHHHGGGHNCGGHGHGEGGCGHHGCH